LVSYQFQFEIALFSLGSRFISFPLTPALSLKMMNFNLPTNTVAGERGNYANDGCNRNKIE
jgi:hypothetical protein